GSYYFALTDILGNSSQKINRNITLRNDETPNIEIVHPAIDTILSQNMLLPLIFSASDDFGIDDIELHYYLNSEKQQQQNIYSNLGKTLLKADYVFDVRNLGLFPGDKITYWLEITDNKPTPQRNKSAYHTARFPSIEEIYNEIAEEEKIRKDLLDETLKKSTALNEEFEEKRRELMKKEDIEWEDKKELEKFLQNQESLNKDVEKIASDYQKMMQKFEDNQALSAETLEKMEKIRELMEEITNDELLEAMKKMQNSLENMDAGDINKALEQMKFSLEDFSEKLEQTLQLLENIKKEQALQKACEIADEMEKMQADLHEKTEQSKENGDDLAKRQA
ncbi:MAG: hypothetical protein KAS49_04475, partial [Candidatus Cloacimonetes bacterium]|nr:hypothetical protein [Candidatus Cloacimonadota bacterium]